MAKAKSPGGRRGGNRTQTAAAGAGQTVTVDTPAPRKRVSPAQFLSQVRAEGRKITWPSRKETWITSVMVLILVMIAAAFFWAVDFILGAGFQQIISLGR